jgi:hypothetical protein
VAAFAFFSLFDSLPLFESLPLSEEAPFDEAPESALSLELESGSDVPSLPLRLSVL